MLLTYSRPVEIPRPFKSFRLDGYSLKAGRRMTLYGKPQLCQLIELEANPSVTAICERPLLIPDSKPKRVVDYWALENGVSTFYLLLRNSELTDKTKLKFHYVEFCKWVHSNNACLKEISIDVFEGRRMWLENWLTTLQHLVTHKGLVTSALMNRVNEALPNSFTLAEVETSCGDLDGMLARAVAYQMLVIGQLRCPSISKEHLHPKTTLDRT